MTDGISVRTARLSDASTIAELTMQLGYEVPASTLRERLGHLLAKDDQQFLVAELDGDVVGWVHVVVTEYIEADAFAVIGGLVVERSHRKHGIGRALMTRAEGWATQKGCSFVRLSSTVTRTEAHRFYENLGYTNIKTQYSFAKPIGPVPPDAIRGFIPRVDR
jgi:GNAT superfamily N-acetyltransferase